MSDLRVFVVLFVRSLDIRANWFSAFVNHETTFNSFPLPHFAHQPPKKILENFHNDGIIK